VHWNSATTPSTRTMRLVSKAANEWCAATGVAASTAPIAPTSPSLARISRPPVSSDTRSCVGSALRLAFPRMQRRLAADRARQVLVQVGQTVHFVDVGVVLAVPALLRAPFPNPDVGIGHDVLDLELLAAVDEAHALNRAEVLRDRNSRVDVVHVRLDV